MPNPDQSDIDGDGVGDRCDPDDCDIVHPYCLNVPKLTMKGASGAKPSGRASIKGDLVVRSPDVFDASGGLTVRVKFDRRPEPAPFEEPVIVTLTEDVRGVDRVGQIQDCAAQRTGLRCRER